MVLIGRVFANFKKNLMARIKPQTLLLQSKKKKGPTRISVATIILCNLTIVFIVLSVVATYRRLYKRTKDQMLDESSSVGVLITKINSLRDSKHYDLPRFAILNTSKGYITVELYKEGTPEVVDRFLDLCQKGHFKGMSFHRVIKHYVIQGGESEDLGAAGNWITKVKLDPLATSPKHEAFMLGTSKNKDGKGFDLFITTAPISDLNDKLSVIGRVIEGEEVVQEIEEVDTDERYRPKSPIGIINITLKQKI